MTGAKMLDGLSWIGLMASGTIHIDDVYAKPTVDRACNMKLEGKILLDTFEWAEDRTHNGLKNRANNAQRSTKNGLIAMT